MCKSVLKNVLFLKKETFKVFRNLDYSLMAYVFCIPLHEDKKTLELRELCDGRPSSLIEYSYSFAKRTIS